MPLIKRYPNRKLYNTNSKRYISLDEIAELIRQGEEVHVLDHASGEDLTALTLTQVLFEEVKKQTGFLPRNLLTGLIQAGGSRISALQRAITSSFGGWSPADDEIRRRINQLVKQGEITQEEGTRWLVKLQTVAPESEETRPLDEQVVERVLEERGAISRRELQSLAKQIEAISRKLDSLRAENEPIDDNDLVG
jgi:polyhydroxyalkanoate synthesis repressor PhaR